MNSDREDSNHFKAHLVSNDNNNETRRFVTEKNCVSLSHITAKLRALFPVLQDKNFSIYWKDEDSDDISIKSEEDWNIFLACGRSKRNPNVRDIYVTYQSSKPKDKTDKDMHIYMSLPDFSMTPGCSKSSSCEKAIHPGVVCDSCEFNIAGTRFKCLVCEDFDLCSNCEKLGLHSQHFMVRIVRPELWNRHWGSRFSKDLFRQIKKTTKLEGHHRRHSHGHHEKRSCPVKDDKGQGISWIDLFAQVMNNWGKVINDDSEEEAAAAALNQARNESETNPEGRPEEKKPTEKMGAEEENKAEKSKDVPASPKGEKRNEKMEVDCQAEAKKSENKIYPKLPEKSPDVDEEDWAMLNDDASNSQTRPASPRGSETSGQNEERTESPRSPQLLQALQRMRETGFDNQVMAEIMELWLQNNTK